MPYLNKLESCSLQQQQKRLKPHKTQNTRFNGFTIICSLHTWLNRSSGRTRHKLILNIERTLNLVLWDEFDYGIRSLIIRRPSSEENSLRPNLWTRKNMFWKVRSSLFHRLALTLFRGLTTLMWLLRHGDKPRRGRCEGAETIEIGNFVFSRFSSSSASS